MAPVNHVLLLRYRETIAWTTLISHFRDFTSLQSRCLNEEGKPYIRSIRMGRNTSWENFARHMTHCVIIEFENEANRDYYLVKDKVHHAFSASARDLIEDTIVVDWKDGLLFDDTSSSAHACSTPSSSNLTGSFTLDSNKRMTGICHCKNIRWTVDLNDYKHVICHCRTCQLLSGGPYTCNSIVDVDALQVQEGKLSVYTYTGASGYVTHSLMRSSWISDPKIAEFLLLFFMVNADNMRYSKPVLCYHCGNCTSHIYHHQMSNPSKIVIRTLLLDGGEKLGIGGEIFAEGKESS